MSTIPFGNSKELEMVERGHSFERFEDNRSPERERTRAELGPAGGAYPQNVRVHFARGFMIWYVATEYGTAEIPLHDKALEEMSEHITVCDYCDAAVGTVRSTNPRLTKQWILSGMLFR
jgi:hypothetical protein